MVSKTRFTGKADSSHHARRFATVSDDRVRVLKVSHILKVVFALTIDAARLYGAKPVAHSREFPEFGPQKCRNNPSLQIANPLSTNKLAWLRLLELVSENSKHRHLREDPTGLLQVRSDHAMLKRPVGTKLDDNATKSSGNTGILPQVMAQFQQENASKLGQSVDVAH